MPSTAASPRRISLDATPEEAALRLWGLPGFAWLDTAGHRHTGGEGISLLAALPREVLRGHLRHPDALRAALQRHFPDRVQVALGFPAGGLIGTVDYDGRFEFGVYDRMLIHQHGSGEWWDAGDLSGCFQAAEPPRGGAVSFRQQVDAAEFLRQVRCAREYIRCGDIYQVNLSHAFDAVWPAGADPFALYLRLRRISPAPYAAFLNLGRRQVLSSSPESFLKMSGQGIRTRPIKGTRPRFRDSTADVRSSLDLLTSEKERAELLMITDLERNDLGQVCDYGSVEVSELLKLEAYAQVFHLVSTVQGTLRKEADHVTALAACFPGGSITGAPKKRAMEIIAELERADRGLYTGAIGCLGANGESRFSIAIRTLTVEDGHATFRVGAGIVADSDPQREWEETLHKAAGLLSAAENRHPH
ncbi:MAG: aminodeoxychorismate synthase component I [Verrucomicrobiales bacterium]|nr:aminodeoxychorismate synthase component I [Verrucomicrobiales bacterium]